MTISFNSIPQGIRVPLVYIEFDNTRAVSGTPGIMHKVLVLGQRATSGSVDAGVPVRVTSAAQAEENFGRGSMLASMFEALKAANRHVETWAIALDDDAAGTAATGTVTITGSAAASGTLHLYVAGKAVRVGVTAGDAVADVASAIAAAVNADTSLPVTASAALGVATLTCAWKGETGNDIDIRTNYHQGQATPAGISVAIAAMSGGTGNPSLTTAIGSMGDEWWNSIVMPYADATSIAALETELLGRWGPTRMLDALAYTAVAGTHAQAGTWGNARNNQLVSCMATGASPTPPYVWAAVNAVVAAASLSIDPARPLQTLVLPGILPPATESRWTMEERNLLLYDGISTYSVDAGGVVRIERQITTYQENAFGVADPSYLDVCTPATLAYLRFATRARITQKFPRHKLADDGTRFGPGQAIVTPSIIRAELLALFRELEAKGLVENFDQYQQELIVERDPDDRNRVNVLSSPNLVNQLRVYAEQIQFIV